MPNAARLAVILSLVGCEGPSERSIADSQSELTTIHCDPGSGLCFPISAPLPAAETCPIDRMVGVTNMPACPAAAAGSGGRWDGLLLFANAGPALRRFCTYDWIPTIGGAAPDLAALPSDAGRLPSVWLAPDCRVVAALGHPYLDREWPALQSAFHSQVDRLSPLPPGSQPLEPPRVVVIDSAPSKDWSTGVATGKLPHGRTVGLVIRELACPSNTGCAAQMESQLALPLEMVGDAMVANPIDGGFFGRQTDLAVAIHRAHARRRGVHAIFNLSVGWEGAFGGPYAGVDPSVLPPPALAVHRAISEAVCGGNLVIAAAGNSGGGPQPSSGLMYPAGWMAKEASASCALFGTPPGSMPPPGTPLVNAIGGVDGRDMQLASTRIGGRPSLVAPADHVVAQDGSNQQGPLPSGVYSGTSMAAAGASGAAAVVWAYRPDLSPWRVMNAVFTSAIAIPEAADVTGPSGAPGGIRRVSICQALSFACNPLRSPGPSGAFVRCPIAVPCPASPPYRNAMPIPIDWSDLPIDGTETATDVAHQFEVGTPCNGIALSSDPAGPAEPCPAEQYLSTRAAPWVVAQPDSPPCNVCGLLSQAVGGTSLTVAINDAVTTPLTSPILTIANGSGVIHFDLSDKLVVPGRSYLIGGDMVVVKNLPIANAASLQAAKLSFVSTAEWSAPSPVLLWK